MKNKNIFIASALILLGLIVQLSLVAQNLNVAGQIDANYDRYSPLVSSGMGVTVTNTLAETTTHTFTVPANSIGSNGVLIATYQVSANTTNGSNKQLVIRFGGTAVRRTVMNVTTETTVPGILILSNRNDPAVQIGVGNGTAPANMFTSFGQSLSTYAVNTAIDQQISIGISNTLATDSMNVNYFNVQILKRP